MNDVPTSPAPAASGGSDGGPLIPEGHKLSSLNVSTADNGLTVNHTTKKIKPSKKDGYDSTYKEHSRVFENDHHALKHIGRVLKARHGNRFSSGERGGSRR